MSRYFILLSAFCVFLLLSSTTARGVLFVDTIFSSSESTITIDSLTAMNGETTSVSTQQLGFSNFASLAVSAPGLNFESSFVSLTSTNDLRFVSTGDDVLLSGGHDFNVNAAEISYFANDIFISSVGEILMLARDTVNISGQNVEAFIGPGGISFESLGGSVNLNSNQALDFETNAALTIHALEDISITTSGNSIFTGEDMYGISENTLSIDSSTSIALVSSTSSVLLDSHDLAMTLGSLTANGGGRALIQSLGDETSVFGYLGVFLKSFGDVSVIGESDGATLSSTGPGGSSLTSTSSSITFTSKGASDESQVYFESKLMNIVTQESHRISSSGSTILSGDNTMEFDAGTVDFQVNRDAFAFTEHVMSYTAGSAFSTDSEFLLIDATDDVTSNNAAGTASFSALVVDVQATNLISMTGGAFEFTAGNSDIVMEIGGDLSFRADFTDGRNQELDIESRNIFFNGGDFFIKGGDVTIESVNQEISSETDLDITANYEAESSYVSFHSDDSSTWNVDSWRHISGNTVFIAQEVPVDESDASFTFGDSLEVSSSGKQDIFIEFEDSTVSSGGDLLLNVDRDFTLSAEDDLQIRSSQDEVDISASDIFSSSETLDINSSDNIVEFNVGRHLISTTDRNEATDDQMEFIFSDSIDLESENFRVIAGAESNILAKDLSTMSTDLELGSGPVSDATVNSGSFEFDIGTDLEFSGNSLSIISETGRIDVNADDLLLPSASRGIDMRSGGTFDFVAGDTFTIDTADELLYEGENGLSVLASEDIFTSGSDFIAFTTTGGDILFSGAEITAFAERNITLSTGDNEGNTLSISSGQDTTISASNIFSMNIEDGPLSMTAGTDIDIESTSSQEFSTGGDFIFQTNTGSVSITADGSSSLTGGDIDFVSTTGDISFSSTNLFSIISKESSVAGEELDSNKDGVSFRSKTTGIEIDNADNDIFFTSNGDLKMTARGVPSGSIFMNSNQILVKSFAENQDIISQSSSTIEIETVNALSITADSDFMMTGVVLSFVQKDFEIQQHDDISTMAPLGSVTINHLGTTTFGVEVTANDVFGVGTARDNVAQFDSTLASSYTSRGMSFFSSGFSESRRNVAGDSNSHQEFEQSVGFSARTYEPLGHIILDSRVNPIRFTADRNMYFDTDQTMLIDTFNGQTWKADSLMSMEAEDGRVYFAGARGINILGKDEAYFMAHQFTEVFSDRNFLVEIDDDFDIASFHADIEVTTFNSADMIVTADDFSKLTAGSEMNVFSNENIFFNADEDFNVRAERGFSLTAAGDLISFTSTNPGNQISSSEETFIQSGGDLLLQSDGDNNQNMRFTGNGIVFSTTAGDITMDIVEDLSFDMETMLINAFGSNGGGRDNVQFTSPASSFTGNDGVFIDAESAVRLGFAANPAIVEFNGLGAPDFAGVVVTSAGNIEYDTDADFLTISRDFTANALAQNNYNAGDSFSVRTVNDILMESNGGIIDINVATDLTHTITNQISFTGGIQNTYTTSAITYLAGTGQFSLSAETDFFNIVEGDLTTTATLSATYISTKPDGEIDFDVGGALSFLTPKEQTLSSDDVVSYDVTGDAIISAAVSGLISLAGANSQLEFDSKANLEITFTGSTTLDSSFANLESENQFLISGVNSMTLTAGDDFSSYSGSTFKLETDGADFDVDHAFRVIARTTNEIDSTTSVTISAIASRFLTEIGASADLNIKSATIAAAFSPPETVNFNAREELEISSVNSVITALSTSFLSTGERSPVNINAPDMSLVANTGVFLAAGDTGASGDFIMDSTTFVVNAGAATGAFSASQQTLVTYDYPPILISAGNQLTMTSGKSLLFAARESTVQTPLEEHQGNIELTGEQTVDFTATTDITFLAEKGSFRATAPDTGKTTLTAALGFTANTHGIDAGINVEANSISPFNFVTTTLTAGQRVDLISEQKQMSITSSSATFETTGPSLGDGYGIQFRTESESATIGFTSQSQIVMGAPKVNNVATNLLEMTSPLGSFTAVETEFRAQGADLGVTGPDVGIMIGTPDTILTMTTNEFSLQSARNLDFSLPDLVPAINNDLLVKASGDINLNFNDNHVQIADDIILTAKSDGIQMAPANNAISFNAPALNFESGVSEDESEIVFSAQGPITAAATNLLFRSENIIHTTVYGSTQYSADFDIFFKATKGDILFRSITAQNNDPYDLYLFGPNEVVITAFERIEHKQHENLAFFQPDNQDDRSEDFAPIQPTTVFPGADCTCDPGGTGINCNNVTCPDNAARIRAMQEALIQYGFLERQN